MQDSSQTCQWSLDQKNAKEDLLDVPIGGYHGAEVCQLIVLFLLNNLNLLLSKDNFELYRDDGFFIIKKRSKRIIEKTRKDTRAVFSEQNLKDRIRQPQDRLPECYTWSTELYIIPTENSTLKKKKHKYKL